MARRAHPRPTDGELEILRVLWSRGPSTVREVLDDLPAERNAGYTTVLKLLQIMGDKGLVKRDRSERAHRYEAVQGEAHTQSHLVGDLLDRAFGGSASQLVMRALSDRRTSPQELAEIRRWLDEREGEEKQ